MSNVTYSYNEDVVYQLNTRQDYKTSKPAKEMMAVQRTIIGRKNSYLKNIWYENMICFTFFVKTIIIKLKNVLLRYFKCLHNKVYLAPLWGKRGVYFYASFYCALHVLNLPLSPPFYIGRASGISPSRAQ